MIDLDDMVMYAKSRIAYAVNANVEYEKNKMQEYFDSLKPAEKTVDSYSGLEYVSNTQFRSLTVQDYIAGQQKIAASNNPYMGMYSAQIGNLWFCSGFSR